MFEKEFHFFMKAMYYSKIIDDIIIAVVLSSLVIWVGGYFLKVKNLYKTIATVIAVILSILIVPIPYKREIEQARQKKIAKYNERKAKYEAAKAVFDEQCKKAGEKIYRTVDNVDGIMLLKIRQRTIEDLNNPMFENAAISNGREQSDKGIYIANFLHSYVSRNKLTGIVVKKGYAFVDVLQEDGSISRYLDYTGHGDIDEERDGVEKNPLQPARYAVTYENNIDPELRKHWVAGTTIKIIDRQTDELLAEKTIFAFAYTMGYYTHGAWFDSRMDFCPKMTELGNNPTSHFAVTVLKP